MRAEKARKEEIMNPMIIILEQQYKNLKACLARVESKGEGKHVAGTNIRVRMVTIRQEMLKAGFTYEAIARL